MEIEFKSNKFRKECDSFKLLVKAQGQQRAKLLLRRLQHLVAAESLEDLRKVPGRYHLLKNRGWQISADLDGPYRLIFEVADYPVPLKENGELDWRGVTEVIIIGIEDTHE
jgi:plasmid maintenance system killer protein